MENIKPIKFNLFPDNIPSTIKEINNWVCWEAEFKENRINKIPKNPKNGFNANCTNTDTWSSFNKALEGYEKYKLSGVGFVLDAKTNIVAIDIDKCLDKEGNISEKALEIIKKIRGYTEISPSRRGIRIFCKGNLPGEKTRKDNLEMYCNKRYVTVTGDVLEELSFSIEDRTEELEQIYNKYLKTNEQVQYMKENIQFSINSSDDIIDKIRKSKQGYKFDSLNSGNIALYNNDHSSADMAMCNITAFWTNRNAELMDMIFRSSGLYRKKWDEVHYTTGQTYGKYIISKAIDECKYVYNPVFEKKASKKRTYDNKKSNIEKSKDEVPKWYIKNERTGNITINQGILAKHLAENEKAICINNTLYVYKDGVYIPIDENEACAIIRKYIDDKYITTKILKDVKFLWISDMRIRKDLKDVNKDINKIVLNNGIYNIRDKKLYEHTPDYLSTVKLDLNFDNFEGCPKFMQFLNEIADVETINLIQELMGYVLIPANKAKKSFILIGPSNTGKSTLLNLIGSILGRENISNIPLQDLANRFATAELFGKLANICGDLPNVPLKDSGIFKMITGDDTIMVERKYNNPFTFVNKARLLFSCNELPGTFDHTNAFYNRIILIKLDKQIEHMNPDLLEDLTCEKDGIFFWAIQGLERLISNNFKFSETTGTMELLNNYIVETSNVLQFINEECVMDENSYIHGQQLYDKYKKFCSNTGTAYLSIQKFTYELLNNVKQVSKKQIGTERRRCFKGIKLK